MPPNAAAIIEFQMASTARRFAPKAEPPLKPSQPSQRMKVPMATSETLCGRKLSSSRSVRRPNTHENARPPMPLPISTGPPPAVQCISTVSKGARRRKTGRTCVVKHAPLECPAMGGPCPAREWAVNKSHPEEAKDEGWENTSAFGEGTHEDGDSDAGKFHLVEAVEQLRDEG
jgi:hypothetical protein